MGDCCDSACSAPSGATPRYRKILWIALIANTIMCFVEIAGSLSSASVSLLADAIDFAGDAGNYALTLAVLAMGLAVRARVAWLKGLTMMVFGLFVLGKSSWAAVSGATPEAVTMGGVAILALAVNVAVALMLYAYREGDANMRSVWLCSRNDALANIAVLLAAVAVAGTDSRWPDLLVAVIIAALGISSGSSVLRQARSELRVASA
jgi:Co/Zn/Cd efflux system component